MMKIFKSSKSSEISYLDSVANICCQCRYRFTYLDIAFGVLFNGYKCKTFTCPICGVENVR